MRIVWRLDPVWTLFRAEIRTAERDRHTTLRRPLPIPCSTVATTTPAPPGPLDRPTAVNSPQLGGRVQRDGNGVAYITLDRRHVPPSQALSDATIQLAAEATQWVP